MDQFKDSLKLYYHGSRQQVDLTFRVSDSYAQTYFLPKQEFEDIVERAAQAGGFNKPGLFVLLKHKYLRWSYDVNGMAHQFRVPRGKWIQLVDDYKRQVVEEGKDTAMCVVP